MFLQDDSSIQPFVHAITSLAVDTDLLDIGSSAFAVVLGSNTTAAGFSRLLQAAQGFPHQRLSIRHNATVSGQPAPAAMQALPSVFFQQLEGQGFAGLKELQLGSCCLLTVLDAAALAWAVPNLAVLQLEQATGATDVMVCAFVACRVLAKLSITGCSKVTRDAALLLIRMLPVLSCLAIENVCDCQSPEACQQLVGTG